ncbi:hypothetical protein BC829DRAFT_180229 [Chytridium lagenaria]|nr:hypothetical protein BC829DRAFT_180229 [Chytridium lagenaria]
MLEDLDFIHGLRETMSISRAIEDLYAFLCIGDQNESFEFSIIAPKVEAALDFLTWVRYFLSITPINLQRTIIYEHVLRIPLEFSPFVLDDDISKAVSVLGWSGFERKEMAGLGILQCEPFWYPQLRCSQPVNRSLSEEQIGYPDHHPPVLHLSLAHEPRFRIMIQSTRDCTFFGKSDDKAVWKRPCLRPYASFMHRRHVLLTTSPDGRYVASLCANGTVKVFDSTTFAELWSFISGGRVTALNFQPSTTNCEYLLTAGIGGITRWSLKKGVSTCTITGKKSGVNANPVSCGFVMDNRERTYCRAYALFVTGYLVIWDLESGSILKSIPPDEDDDEFFSYGSACVSMDGRYLLYGSRMVKMYQCSSLVPFWSQPLFPRSAADLKNA